MSRAALAAASMSEARWSPGSCTSPRSKRASSLPAALSRAVFPSKKAPSAARGGMEGDGPGLSLPRQREHGGVVRIHHRPVVRALVREDARLGLPVLLEARVAIEMIGGEVQEHGHVRPKRVRPLELEAGDLEH